MSDQIIVSRRGLERVNDLLIEQRIGAAGTVLTQIIDGAPPAEEREPVYQVRFNGKHWSRSWMDCDREAFMEALKSPDTTFEARILYTAPAEQPSEAERRKIKLKITSRRNLEPMPIEDEAEQALDQLAAEAQQQGLYEQPSNDDKSSWTVERRMKRHERERRQEQPITAQEAIEAFAALGFSISSLDSDIHTVLRYIHNSEAAAEFRYMDGIEHGKRLAQEQAAQDREDAERYRFLRSLLDKDGDFIDPLFPDHAPETLEEFDAHIDSAREKARQQGKGE